MLRVRRATVAALALSVVVAGCGLDTVSTSTNASSTVSNARLLWPELHCDGPGDVLIQYDITITYQGWFFWQPTGSDQKQSFTLKCIRNQSPGPQLRYVVTRSTASHGDEQAQLVVGPDTPADVDQTIAQQGSGFTPQKGLGDTAGYVVETLDSVRTNTLYVVAQGTAFDISIQASGTDHDIRDAERQVAEPMVKQLPPSSASASPAPVNPADPAAFVGGDYTAGLLTAEEIASAVGRPVLPLDPNGGRSGFAPGVDVSNAQTTSKDGTVNVALQVYRLATPAAARHYYDTLYGPEITPQETIPALGDSAFLEPVSGLVVVLRGREIATLRVGGSSVDSVAAEKTLAARVVPRLLAG